MAKDCSNYFQVVGEKEESPKTNNNQRKRFKNWKMELISFFSNGREETKLRTFFLILLVFILTI